MASQFFCPQPKPRPSALDRADKKAAQASADRQGSEEARKRAAGRCEVVVIGEGRCPRRDNHTHHMIGGRLRGKGESALASRKQRTCDKCHRLITEHVLVRVGGVVPSWRDKYRRVT